jgi:hypothetical protein
VHVVEGDPLDSWDHFRQLVEKLEASGTARVTFAAPFVQTVFGSDRYADELWP